MFLRFQPLSFCRLVLLICSPHFAFVERKKPVIVAVITENWYGSFLFFFFNSLPEYVKNSLSEKQYGICIRILITVYSNILAVTLRWVT